MNNRIFNFYPSLLDKFQHYLDSAEIYQQYYGFSEDAKISEQEFDKKLFDDLINGINRVKFESDAANLGTAFNIAADYLILGQKSDEIKDLKISEGIISFFFKNEKYGFNLSLFDKLRTTYHNAAAQIFVERQLATTKGIVNLYGYADYLTPYAWHDLKTTSRYKAGKFYKSWQRVVYPYCGLQMGINISEFQFDVVVWNSKSGAELFTEYYRYLPERDIPRLREHCERLIDFIDQNEQLITDLKIFNKHQN